MIICLHRLTGDCPDCGEDLDTNHHPNNLDCRNYTPISVYIQEVGDDRGDILCV